MDASETAASSSDATGLRARSSRRATKKPQRFREDEAGTEQDRKKQQQQHGKEKQQQKTTANTTTTTTKNQSRTNTKASTTTIAATTAAAPAAAVGTVAKPRTSIVQKKNSSSGARCTVRSASVAGQPSSRSSPSSLKPVTTATAKGIRPKAKMDGDQNGSPPPAAGTGTNNRFGNLSIQKPLQVDVGSSANDSSSSSRKNNQRSPAFGFLDVLAEQAVITPRAKDKIDEHGGLISNGSNPVATRGNIVATGPTPVRRRASFLQTASGLDDATALYQDGKLEVEVEDFKNAGSLSDHGKLSASSEKKSVHTVPPFAFKARPDYDAKKDPGCLYHIDDLHPCDVLVARGGAGRNHVTGNLLFRRMVEYLQPMYTEAAHNPTKPNSKRSVAECLVGEVQKYGGRFLHLYQGEVELGKSDGKNNIDGDKPNAGETDRSTKTPPTAGEWWYELDDVNAREKAAQKLRTEQSSETLYAEAKASLIEFYDAVGDVPKGSSPPDEDDEKVLSALRQMQEGGGAAARRISSPSSTDNLKQLADVVMGQIHGSNGKDSASLVHGTEDGAPASGGMTGYAEAEMSRISPNSSNSAVASLGVTTPAASPTPSVGSKQGSSNGMDLLMSVASAASADYALPSSERRKTKKRADGKSTPKKAKASPLATSGKKAVIASSESSASAIDAQYAHKPDGYEHLFGQQGFASSSIPSGVSNSSVASPTASSDTPPPPPPKPTKSSNGGGNANRRPSDAEARRLRRNNKAHTDVRSETYPFPYKLFELIENAPPEICTWTKGGRAFIVHSHEEFRQKLLPMYFGHNVMRSFVRQLSYWAFDKLSDPRVTLMSAGGCMWRNTYFQQGRHDLLKHVERVRVAGKRKKPPTSAPPPSSTTTGGNIAASGNIQKKPKLTTTQTGPKSTKPKPSKLHKQQQQVPMPVVPPAPSVPTFPAQALEPQLAQDVVEV
mmetsp:Transcript_22277/g.52441  ORF Transcript_22277/g.52441 Transcript_22277/m.52441 type:complete len:950 (-) Transcript_22277:261-3110(-)